MKIIFRWLVTCYRKWSQNHQRGVGGFLCLLGVHKQFWYHLGCFSSKGPQRELSPHLWGYCVPPPPPTTKKTNGIVLKLVPLTGEEKFKPSSQNRILVPLGSSLQNFWLAPHPFYIPPPPPLVYPGGESFNAMTLVSFSWYYSPAWASIAS